MKEQPERGLTRRRFIQTTIAGGVVVSSIEAASVPTEGESDRARLKRIAKECGSELGRVQRVGR